MKAFIFSILSIFFFSFFSCQDYSLDQETLDQIDSASARHYNLLEEFSNVGDWSGHGYSSEGGGFIEVGAENFISDGTLQLSANQGQDCDRERVELAYDSHTDFIELLAEDDDLHIEITLNEARTGALGFNSFSYSNGYTTTEVIFHHLEERTTFEFILDHGEIIEAYENGEVAESYWISRYNSSIPIYNFVFESDACGPDLYASADMEVDRFAVFRTRN